MAGSIWDLIAQRIGQAAAWFPSRQTEGIETNALAPYNLASMMAPQGINAQTMRPSSNLEDMRGSDLQAMLRLWRASMGGPPEAVPFGQAYANYGQSTPLGQQGGLGDVAKAMSADQMASARLAHFAEPAASDIWRPGWELLPQRWPSGSVPPMYFPPQRAGGGPVNRDQPYVVGEQGPELFVPQTAGTVVPTLGYGGMPTAFPGLNMMVVPRGPQEQPYYPPTTAIGIRG